eukprot:s225_g2.t1
MQKRNDPSPAVTIHNDTDLVVHLRPRPRRSRSHSIPRTDLQLRSRSPHRPPRPPVNLREASNPEWNTPHNHYSNWNHSNPRSKWDTHSPSTSHYSRHERPSWSQPWEPQSDSSNRRDSYHSYDTSSTWPSKDTSRGQWHSPSCPPLTAFTDTRRSSATSWWDRSQHHDSSTRYSSTIYSPSRTPAPHDEVLLTTPSVTDEEWINTVRLCLKDSTRTLAATELFDKDRPKLATATTKQVRDAFTEAVKNLDSSISESKIQSLISVLGASYLLEEIMLDSMYTFDLPKTNKTALVIPLSHIARFKEKAPFLDKAIYSWALVHGTNIVGAKYALAEALVRPADWTYCEQLHKSELPTYGCYNLGAAITSREGDIPRWNLVDLLDRAVTRGKGQQEILLALQYKGACEHLALKAGGNDMVQLQRASHGVVTSAEKYTVARSEHCTIKNVVVAWDDLSFIRNRQNQSRSYNPTDPKDGSKDAKDEKPPDPDNRRLRSGNLMVPDMAMMRISKLVKHYALYISFWSSTLDIVFLENAVSAFCPVVSI